MLFQRIAELNVLANVARKGREDLNEDVLMAAIDTLSCRNGCEDASNLARSVCEDLLKSFEDMCEYFRALEPRMETVDAILRYNKGLVDKLAEFEEAWEMAALLIRDASVRCCLDGVFSTVQRIRELEPRFQQICCDCDVELFLIIPRVTLLAYLNSPTRSALMKTLLPQTFEDKEEKDDLQTLCQHFEAIILESPEHEDMLMRQLVHGPGIEETSAFIPHQHQDMIQAFMRELEHWSIVLQRRDALDWNAFCTVVARFLSFDCNE
jgi:hypothetical protein